MHPDALKSLEILRSPDFFNWSFAVYITFVTYVYSVEIEKRNWNIVFGALAFYGLEWFIEIMNGLVLHFTQFSPIWTSTGRTIFQLLPGLNLEISVMFAVGAVVFLKLLPKEKNFKIMGVNNRLFFTVFNAVFMVLLECVVNAWGYLPWNYSWWNFPHIYFIVLVGYMPYFFLSFYVHDLEKMNKKIAIVLSLFALDLILYLVFAVGLKWI